jgi:serine/threonine protein kinase
MNTNEYKQIGSGSYGRIYKKDDTTAIKKMHLSNLDSIIKELTVSKKVQECDLLLKYNNICCDKSYYYAEMPLYSGTLDNYEILLASDSEIFDIFLQISYAILYTHSKGIIHRDIKAGNVLIGAPMIEPTDVAKSVPFFATNSKICLCDFGLSVFYGIDEKMCNGVITITHRPPELFVFELVNRNSNYDFRIDVWSFGMLILNLICKKSFYRFCIKYAEKYNILGSTNAKKRLRKDDDDIFEYILIHREIFEKCLEKCLILNVHSKFTPMLDILKPIFVKCFSEYEMRPQMKEIFDYLLAINQTLNPDKSFEQYRRDISENSTSITNYLRYASANYLRYTDTDAEYTDILDLINRNNFSDIGYPKEIYLRYNRAFSNIENERMRNCIENVNLRFFTFANDKEIPIQVYILYIITLARCLKIMRQCDYDYRRNYIYIMFAIYVIIENIILDEFTPVVDLIRMSNLFIGFPHQKVKKEIQNMIVISLRYLDYEIILPPPQSC